MNSLTIPGMRIATFKDEFSLELYHHQIKICPWVTFVQNLLYNYALNLSLTLYLYLLNLKFSLPNHFLAVSIYSYLTNYINWSIIYRNVLWNEMSNHLSVANSPVPALLENPAVDLALSTYCKYITYQLKLLLLFVHVYMSTETVIVICACMYIYNDSN